MDRAAVSVGVRAVLVANADGYVRLRQIDIEEYWAFAQRHGAVSIETDDYLDAVEVLLCRVHPCPDCDAPALTG